jgi:hypothetical protein
MSGLIHGAAKVVNERHDLHLRHSDRPQPIFADLLGDCALRFFLLMWWCGWADRLHKQVFFAVYK